MKVAIIGRGEWLYRSARLLHESGIDIQLVVTAKAAPEYAFNAADFEAFAKEIGATYRYSAHISKAEQVALLRSMQLDVGVSANYPNIISQEVIDQFSIGVLNAHGGDLPRYRGNACQAWAILNEEERIGLCVHKMVGGELDSGDIISRDYYPINLNTKITEVYKWMDACIPALFKQALQALAQNPSFILEAQSKDPADSLRCYPRRPEDGKIDWNQSNERVLRLINASNKPYAGAFCDLDGQSLIIWDATLFEDEEIYLAFPGQVAQVNASEGTVDVICGKGKIRLVSVEFNGQVVAAAQVIKSIRKRLK
ncbi:MAG: methionyl-tRNA formyltransferase [Salibacteraceae bacterium]